MMKRKLYATLLGTGVALTAMSPVFAAEPATEQQANEPAAGQVRIWHKVEKMDESKLAELAKEKGISVDELKQQLQQKHEEKLEQIAKQKGISVDELKKQLPDSGQL